MACASIATATFNRFLNLYQEESLVIRKKFIYLSEVMKLFEFAIRMVKL